MPSGLITHHIAHTSTSYDFTHTLLIYISFFARCHTCHVVRRICFQRLSLCRPRPASRRRTTGRPLARRWRACASASPHSATSATRSWRRRRRSRPPPRATAPTCPVCPSRSLRRQRQREPLPTQRSPRQRLPPRLLLPLLRPLAPRLRRCRCPRRWRWCCSGST